MELWHECLTIECWVGIVVGPLSLSLTHTHTHIHTHRHTHAWQLDDLEDIGSSLDGLQLQCINPVNGHQTVCIDDFYLSKSLLMFVRSKNALIANFVFPARKCGYRLHMRTRESCFRVKGQASVSHRESTCTCTLASRQALPREK